MLEPAVIPDFDEPIAAHARKDLPLLRVGMTAEEALAQIRSEGLGERVIYFYVVNDERRLGGVLPTRRLLTALAVTDFCALLFYFGSAALVLR